MAGVSAETMAVSVATPLERQLSQIPGITQLTSQSTVGAFAMVGGLALSQPLTLYTTPVVYLYLDRLRLWFRSGREDPVLENERIKKLPPSRFRNSGGDDKF
jgi:hypothetical protein